MIEIGKKDPAARNCTSGCCPWSIAMRASSGVSDPCRVARKRSVPGGARPPKSRVAVALLMTANGCGSDCDQALAVAYAV
ncbi:hypothetical protein [Novosphingobium sp.]|uniref:hypothetical protein n=1 Tax=Novosphingobium sp. TaxID=1874826 RepID=UPI003B525205